MGRSRGESATDWAARTLGRRVEGSRHVQTLWGGYGVILRLRLAGGSTAILKQVEAGAGSGRSHQRKLRSYRVEQAFYGRYAQPERAGCRVPRCLGLEGGGGRFWMLLEDLDAAGFAGRRGRMGRADLDACLRWLAAFHAAGLGASTEGLWREGTYWHLATRPDELAVMADGPLKEAAGALDARLAAARFRTLVHGDAKPANFCFGAGVAAVDFQYVGGGCGMKDVAYLLGCLAPAELDRNGDRLLDTYFALLRAELEGRDDVDGAALEAEWRALYPLAWADFARFLAGWAPGHGGDGRAGRRLIEQALASL